ncbi:hypothetical protein DPMN_006665 [Dreissena polymorpha]|uniref:Nucleotide-diphospho-sugar transferase domain-containing protein n=2 Tax=Dreissena polymorpha TaxID=45954 RepID=A0A9D4RV62_DREPO|nr:hypothetical protein DPMN_006665 [Dreissena polymorpha]
MVRPKRIILLSVFLLTSVALYLYLVGDEPGDTALKRTAQLANIDSVTRGQNVVIIEGETNNNDNAIQDDIVSVAKRASRSNKTVLLTMVNDAYLSFTYSWLCNTKDMGIHQSVLIITTDEISKTNLTRDWPEIHVFSMEMTTSKGDQTYSHAGYIKIMVKRTEMILAILMADIEIFLFEVDCLWLANPTPALQQEKGVDILVNPVEGVYKVYAGGFLYLFTTPRAKSLWKQLTVMMMNLGQKVEKMNEKQYISEAENDQQYISKLINDRYGGLLIKELSLDVYADGKWYEKSESDRAKLRPVIINNNWVLGNKKKMERAMKWKHWFIRPDWSCDMDLVRQVVYH